MFLRQGGSINCTVTGSRKFSIDLAQGGLEITFIFTFKAPTKDLLEKTQRLIEEVYSTASNEIKSVQLFSKKSDVPEPKRRKVEKQTKQSSQEPEIWVSLANNIVLKQHERKILVDGQELTDIQPVKPF